jgi:signal transduction histidine kinase
VKKAHVSLAVSQGQTHLVVEDEGRGFNPEDADKGAGFGLFSIRERLSRIGGEMHIDSSPGHGTRVTLIIPLQESRSMNQTVSATRLM